MNYEDTLQVQFKVYDLGYIQIGDKFYSMLDDGTPDYDSVHENAGAGYDKNGNPNSVTTAYMSDFGKCVIFPNDRASTITLADGNAFSYAYEVIAPLSKRKYKMLPKEGDIVHISKQDGTVDKTMEVKGFVTLKKRYLKIWL